MKAKSQGRTQTHSDGTKTYALLYPITVNGRSLQTINLRRVTVADLGACRKLQDQHSTSRMMLTRIGELSEDEVDSLDAADWTSLSEQMLDFLEPPQAMNN